MNTVNASSQLLKVGQLSASDLQMEAAGIEGAEMWRTDEYNGQQVSILWVPSIRRAGVAWGSDAIWIDADSPQDALERFFSASN